MPVYWQLHARADSGENPGLYYGECQDNNGLLLSEYSSPDLCFNNGHNWGACFMCEEWLEGNCNVGSEDCEIIMEYSPSYDELGQNLNVTNGNQESCLSAGYEWVDGCVDNNKFMFIETQKPI